MRDPEADRREAEAVLDTINAGVDAAAQGEPRQARDLLTPNVQ
jgi:hypothetical protein